jgi:hypothetical protein
MNADEGVAAVETGGKRRSSASHLIFQIPLLAKKKDTPFGVSFLFGGEGGI